MGCLESKEIEAKNSDVELSGTSNRDSARDHSVKNPIINNQPPSVISKNATATQANLSSKSKSPQQESPPRQTNAERQSEDLKMSRPVSVNRGSEHASPSTPPRPVSLGKQPSKLSELLQAEKLKASGIQRTTVL